MWDELMGLLDCTEDVVAEPKSPGFFDRQSDVFFASLDYVG